MQKSVTGFREKNKFLVTLNIPFSFCFICWENQNQDIVMHWGMGHLA